MDPLQTYFGAEKRESLVFVAAGLVALAVSALLLLKRHPYWAISIPLLAVGLIQLAVGGTVLLRTDRQVAELRLQLEQAPAQARAQELTRMQVVMNNFLLYKGVEIALCLAGLALTLAFARGSSPWAAGVGLFAQAALMLVFDLFAEARGDVYLAWLKQL